MYSCYFSNLTATPTLKYPCKCQMFLLPVKCETNYLFYGNGVIREILNETSGIVVGFLIRNTCKKRAIETTLFF